VTRLKERTLKRVYEQRAQREAVPQLLEAVDQAKIQQITAALAKLDGLVPDGANLFNQAIEAAKTDLGNYLRGGVKQFFKNIAGDPVLKATSLANAIRAGLSNLPTIAKLYLPRGMEKEAQRSVLELVPQEKQQQMLAAMVKAFEPETNVDIGSIFKGNSMPYVKNLQAAVQELLQNVAPNAGFKLAQQAAATPPTEVQQATPPTDKQAAEKTPTPGAEPNSGPSSAGAAPTVGSEPTQAAAATNTTQASAPTKAAQAPATQKKLNPKTDRERIDNIAYFLASQTGIDKAAAAKLIAKLAELNGLTDIPTPQKPSNKLAPNVPS
jgi:hypothetical protein